MLKVAVFNDTSTTGHYGCRLVMHNLGIALRRHGMQDVWHWPVGVDWRETRKKLPSRGDVDAVIVNGEGTLHHSAVRTRPKCLAEVARFAHDQLGVPAFVVNATLYANDEPFYQELRNFDGIFVRDSGSLIELQTFGIDGRVTADLTFYEDLPVARVRSETGMGVGSVRGDVSVAIRRICEQEGWLFRDIVRPRLRPGQVLRDPAGAFSAGLACLREGMTLRRNDARFASLLSRHGFVLTGRYHAVTMCLLTNTPFLAVESNTPKTQWLLEDVFGESDRAVLLRELPEIDLTRAKIWDEAESLHVARFVRRARRSIDHMLDAIRARVGADKRPAEA